jgi:hypothetical protein
MFQGPMVRAILAGKKTQTRRVIKPAPFFNGVDEDGNEIWRLTKSWSAISHFPRDGQSDCPFGMPGDQLWVREKFWKQSRQRVGYAADMMSYGIADEHNVETGDVIPDSKMFPSRMYGTRGVRWQPSIHMPQWASRLTLEITDIRAERLQAITREDVRAEGVPETFGEIPDWVESRFPELASHEWDNLNWAAQWERCWDSINGKTFPWSSNPFVWAITFKVITPSAGGAT